MLLYDLHKYILLFFLFYPKFFSVSLATNIFVVVIEKNVPRHLLASRAVACDKLHLRAGAHFGHVSAFLCNREFLGISCYIKNNPQNRSIKSVSGDIIRGVFRISFCYTILLPFAVILNFAPSISHARRHMSMRCKKISKYSSMEQMFSSIFKFRVITFFSSFTFNFASVTA